MNDDTLPLEWSAGRPDASVLLLHGLGADGHDLLPIAQALEIEHVRFVLPDAPVRPISMYDGYPMRAWFDLTHTDGDMQQDDAGLRAAREQVSHWIRRETERGVAVQRIALAGFSQGAALALYSGLTLGLPLAGIAALSGWLPHLVPSAPAVPVWAAHGSEDPVVPLAWSQASYAAQPQLGITPHLWPMRHEICAEEIGALRTWLQQKLRGQASA